MTVGAFYWYFCGNYHFFDLFGKWYGKKKKWSGILFLIVLIVLGDVGSLIAAQIQ